MDKIAVNRDFSHAFRNGEASVKAGFSIVTLGKIFNKVNYYCRERTRNDYLLLLTLDGEAWVKEGKRKKKLRKGSWFILRPGLVHSYRDIVPWSLAYVHFYGTSAAWTVNELGFLKRENLGFMQADNSARELLFRLISRAEDVSISGEIIRNAMLVELLVALHQNYRRNKNDNDPLEAVREYIGANLDKELTLPCLAELSGFSQFHFIRVFRGKYGYSPIQFIQKLRIEKAKELLGDESESMKVREVAKASGFKDPLYFSKAFRQWTGTSPEKFRDYMKLLNHR
ncbi:MAG: hypothetical protein A2017_04485 [Lentisphaerae bacterium GWF2_44_16]|nr:MAG: hypothetical protein A2017_04485 [Lentisphaerae bacterium GWF2_44_16]